MEIDALFLKVFLGCICLNASFAVDNAFLWRSKDLDPTGVDGVDQDVGCLVGNYLCHVPSGTTIQKMENDVVVHENEVTLHLLVEAVWNFDV